MQLPTRDGIMCDQCGLGCRHDFIYYSYDIRIADMVANKKPPLEQIINSQIVSSVDICPACFDRHKSVVILANQRAIRNAIICELSGQFLSDQPIFYYAVVAKVTVRMSSGKQATTVDDRYLEFSISESVYRELVKNAGKVRKVAGEWSTKSKDA